MALKDKIKIPSTKLTGIELVDKFSPVTLFIITMRRLIYHYYQNNYHQLSLHLHPHVACGMKNILTHLYLQRL